MYTWVYGRTIRPDHLKVGSDHISYGLKLRTQTPCCYVNIMSKNFLLVSPGSSLHTYIFSNSEFYFSLNIFLHNPSALFSPNSSGLPRLGTFLFVFSFSFFFIVRFLHNIKSRQALA